MSLFPFPHLSEKGNFRGQVAKTLPFIKCCADSVGTWHPLGRRIYRLFLFFFPFCLVSQNMYWFGQKVCLSFSVRCYRKTQTNFLPLSSPSPPAFNLSQSGSFLVSLFFASGGQRIRVPASASILPVNIQDWFPLELAGWISLQSKGLSRVFSNTTVQKYQFFGAQKAN